MTARLRILFTAVILILSVSGFSQTLPKDKLPIKKTDTVQFQVKAGGKLIPGILTISGLQRQTQVISNRTGGDQGAPRRSPGLTEYQPLTLTRAKGPDTFFEAWADKVYQLQSGMGSPKTFRKDVVIDILNSQGQVILSYRVYRCWPSYYEALSSLDVSDQGVATETLVLEHEGWERDPAVTDPGR